jgi:hypothetical protein
VLRGEAVDPYPGWFDHVIVDADQIESHRYPPTTTAE